MRHPSTQLLLLLGAGASSEFQISTMTKLTQKFEREHTKYLSAVQGAKATLTRVGFPTNIETVLSFAQGSIAPKNVVLHSSPFVSTFISSKARLIADRHAKPFVKDIKEFISRECTISEDYRINLVVKHYRRFFSHLIKQFHLGNLGNAKSPYPDLDLFTTNYDNVVEQYCNRLGRELFFGYTQLGDETAIFTPRYYDRYRGVRLYKLHGSVTLGTLANGRTFYSRQGLRIGDKLRGVRIVDRVMIYGYEKIPSQDPYFELLYRLKSTLSKVPYAIVIGYSFSDLVILDVLRSAVEERRGELKLLLLNPHSAEIKKKKFSNSPFVRAIPGNFSDFLRLKP